MRDVGGDVRFELAISDSTARGAAGNDRTAISLVPAVTHAALGAFSPREARGAAETIRRHRTTNT
jgi:hypothetical protein